MGAPIQGRFPETLGDGHDGLNHRQYVFTTQGSGTISEVMLLYDPGFQVIDGSIFQAEGPAPLLVGDW